MRKLVLGADLSTDKLEYLVADAGTGESVTRGSFNFLDLFGPKHGLTKGGFLELDNGAVRIPYGLFPDALDEMLTRVCAELKGDKQYLARIIVSVQQHGMVAWKRWAEGQLLELGKDPKELLSRGINHLLATDMATSWRDTSSYPSCVALEGKMLPDRWADLTGSSPLQAERFLGAQILRLAGEDPMAFRETGHFTVLASFVASLLVGRPVPIGLDEASCTLLMNLRRGKWATKALRGIFPPGTFQRLPEIVEPCQKLGNLWSYHVQRHGLPATCNVSLGMGDNIAAQITTANVPDQVCLSMGSSGTVYKEMRRASFDPAHACHVLRTGQGSFMGMFCTPHCSKLADQVRVRQELSWGQFDTAVKDSQFSNSHEMVFVGRDGELVTNGSVGPGSAAAVTRSIIINMKRHCAFMGRPKSIVATGGFVTLPVAQVIADIFGCPVFVQATTNRVSLGSVVMGISQETGAVIPEVVKVICPKGERVDQNPARAHFYQQFEEQFALRFPG